ncbi:hypothetical protein Slin15195_G045090 [Septoria linicola]|uniref:Xylanolytic transcriptional activator regulatory domain-containing protein n=1 Tax=Septoria linicola TaxID=215465 RepID=A0A9Q9ARH7_9PEZI|nr:hypothetical protein Slin14017_G048610 [Septoria linicola]USW51190.1 hypothetical protein Slin15195_G045090 [Septoria linicola]
MESYLELQRRKILASSDGRTPPYGQQSLVAVREPTRCKDASNDMYKMVELEDQVLKLAERLAVMETKAESTAAWAKDTEPPSRTSSRQTHRRSASSLSLNSGLSTIEPTIPEETPTQTPTSPCFPFHTGSNNDACGEQDLTPKRLWAMWQHYRSNVDPLLKIFHIPAVQHLFLATDEEAKNLKPDAESIKFAICFAAAASLQTSPEDATACPTSSLLSTYAAKLEASLAKSRFMSEPTVAAVQALALYLITGQRFLDASYVWSLLAILVRVATKLKLNHDPETQGLSFLDCEYRRRLWWHICTLDARVAELNHSDPLIYERKCTARFPVSIQDSDFDSIQDIDAKRNCTKHNPDMFCSLLRFEITYYMRTVLFSEDFMEENGWPILPIDGKLSVIEYLEKTLEEKYYRACNCTTSTCRLAIASSKITVARFKLSALLGEHGVSELSKDEMDEVMAASAIVLENLRDVREDPSLSRWAWLSTPQAEWDAAALCLSALVLVRTKTKPVTRAWNALTSFFIAWKESSYDPALYKKWIRLEGLKTKAEAIQRQSNGDSSAGSQVSNYTAYSPGASLSATTKPSASQRSASPDGGTASQVGSVSSKSSGSVRSAFSEQDWPFPKQALQEHASFDLKLFALMV